MPIIKDINSLVPQAAIHCNRFLGECGKINLPVTINETVRMPETQILYYLQGRIDFEENPDILAEFNKIRGIFRFWDIGVAESKRKITWKLDSNHLYGIAFDAVPLDSKGKPWWNAPLDVQEKMGECGERAGLVWGGRWSGKKRDWPHFEWRENALQTG